MIANHRIIKNNQVLWVVVEVIELEYHDSEEVECDCRDCEGDHGPLSSFGTDPELTASDDSLELALELQLLVHEPQDETREPNAD